MFSVLLMTEPGVSRSAYIFTFIKIIQVFPTCAKTRISDLIDQHSNKVQIEQESSNCNCKLTFLQPDKVAMQKRDKEGNTANVYQKQKWFLFLNKNKIFV